jgi:hypothetical protein
MEVTMKTLNTTYQNAGKEIAAEWDAILVRMEELKQSSGSKHAFC